jgi:hypothetical protein
MHSDTVVQKCTQATQNTSVGHMLRTPDIYITSKFFMTQKTVTNIFFVIHKKSDKDFVKPDICLCYLQRNLIDQNPPIQLLFSNMAVDPFPTY